VGLRILVVDDNEDAAEMLRTLLTSCNHEVLVAHSGEQALEGAGAFAPVAGLLDIGMPGMSGYELAAALRRDPITAGMFLVAITGWGQHEDRQRALTAGFDAHMTKPADPEAILALLAERFASGVAVQGEIRT
jgi:CheY-like chemotaxis protein